MQNIKTHLYENKCTYQQHFTFAIKAGALMIVGGLASLIHAFLPCLFDGVSARIVSGLYKGRIKNHPNKAYRNM